MYLFRFFISIILGVVALFFISNCDNSPNETDSDLFNDTLVGDWEWVSSSGGIAGLYLTPLNKKYGT